MPEINAMPGIEVSSGKGMGVYVISLIGRKLEKDRTTERSIIKTTERKTPTQT